MKHVFEKKNPSKSFLIIIHSLFSSDINRKSNKRLEIKLNATFIRIYEETQVSIVTFLYVRQQNLISSGV